MTREQATALHREWNALWAECNVNPGPKGRRFHQITQRLKAIRDALRSFGWAISGGEVVQQ